MDPTESTVILLDKARAGDKHALDSLFARCLRPLQRWAAGRLPAGARDLADTHDLVQDVLLQTVKNLGTFQARSDGALQAYLRQALLNRVRDEIRNAARRPAGLAPTDNLVDVSPSPLEAAIGREAVDCYEAALARLDDEEREAITSRLELGLSYEEVAAALGKPSGEAARKAVKRAIVRLVEEMNHGR
jgi:RNA polymerase sigma-70 factor (ECF subfamily)